MAAVGPDTPDDLRAAGHIAAVYIADAVGLPDVALELGVTASHFAERAGSPLLQSLSLCLVGNARCWMAPECPAPADIAIVERALEMALREPETVMRWGWASRSAVLVTALLVLTDVLRYNDARRASTYVDDVLTGYDVGDDAHTGSFVLRAVGALDADAGRWAPAEQRLTASLALATRAASLRSRSRSLEELARLAWRRDDLQPAAALAESAVKLAQETGHVLNWVRCAGLAADIALEVGDLARAGTLLDQADAAAGSRRAQVALQTTAPRRARYARLSGQPDQAELYLQLVTSLEDASGLTPDRVVYLLEAAYSALGSGRLQRAEAMVHALRDATLAVGIELPTPERRRLAEITG